MMDKQAMSVIDAAAHQSIASLVRLKRRGHSWLPLRLSDRLVSRHTAAGPSACSTVAIADMTRQTGSRLHAQPYVTLWQDGDGLPNFTEAQA
jgi:hypothetical protein